MMGEGEKEVTKQNLYAEGHRPCWPVVSGEGGLMRTVRMLGVTWVLGEH